MPSPSKRNVVKLSVVMQRVKTPGFKMLSGVMLSIDLLSVIMLSVVMLSIIMHDVFMEC
jgi:hypothetical protein